MKPVLIKILATIVVGFICSAIAYSLHYLTELTEYALLNKAISFYHGVLIVGLPFLGLLIIWLLNRYVFKGPASKGISEVLQMARSNDPENLKTSKIPSHFLSGWLTVMTGGSTGIEVSTVVTSAATGSWMSRSLKLDYSFQKHLLIAGAAAGLAALFQSPLGGLFFALEVLSATITIELIGYIILAVVVSAVFIYLEGTHAPMFSIDSQGWRWKAVPFFIVLSVITACLSSLLTVTVVRTKSFFIRKFKGVGRVVIGGLCVGIIVFALRPLYGEGYPLIIKLISGNLNLMQLWTSSGKMTVLFLILILILKPLATSITLASGGDGGIFAPSLFLGAVAGYLLVLCINSWLALDLFQNNFIVIGMAALLSASIHAPLAATFLCLSITGAYELLVPVLFTSVLSSIFVKRIVSYTVYSYSGVLK